MSRKLKILVSCYACSPDRGSEPGMGWHFVKGLSNYHEVHVIVEKRKWEQPLKAYLEAHPECKQNLKFYFIDKKRHKTLRKIWPPSYYWFYKQWQKKAYALALTLNKTENFDLIHQLNMVGYREPGYLWQMQKPFVWGPIGGMENTNYKLLFNLPFMEFVYYSLRNIINTYQKLILKRPKKAANHSNSMLIAATTKNQQDILKYWKTDSIVMPEVGQHNVLEPVIQRRMEYEPLVLLWSGQHTGGKALNILLHSLVLLPEDINWELHILGEGAMTKTWSSLAIDLGISNKCKWHGWLARSKALEIMAVGHLLCITSIKDLTSTVTLEGLSLGMPVITLDHCGFSHVVNESCGIKIPIAYPRTLHQSYKKEILRIYKDEHLRYQLGLGAFERAKTFNWEQKIKKLNAIYKDLVN